MASLRFAVLFCQVSSLSLPLLFLLLINLPTIPPVSVEAAPQQQHHSSSTANITWRAIPSLLQSLLNRIVNYRLARGDVEGANRVRSITEAIGSGFQFWKRAGTMGWDYLIHYSWRHWKPSDVMYLVSLISEFHAAVGEVIQLRSSSERILWVSANYDRVQQIAKSVLQKLLEFFNRSGALRDCVLAIQKEMLNGELIRDALELGSADLQGLVQVAKDVFQRYYGSYSSSASEL